MVKATTDKMGKVDSKAFADNLHGLTIKAADEPGILMDVTFSETGDIDRQSFLVEGVEGKQGVKQVLPKVKRRSSPLHAPVPPKLQRRRMRREISPLPLPALRGERGGVRVLLQDGE